MLLSDTWALSGTAKKKPLQVAFIAFPYVEKMLHPWSHRAAPTRTPGGARLCGETRNSYVPP